MASGVRLNCNFICSNGKSKTWSYGQADPDVLDSDVKSFMQGMIEYGIIFDSVPVQIKSAKVVQTIDRTLNVT